LQRDQHRVSFAFIKYAFVESAFDLD
jgi:hypothetical protein